MRTPIKPTKAVADGSYLASHNRPPAAVMPAPFAAVVAEYDALRIRLDAARREVATMRAAGWWANAEAEAKTADAKASAEAVRAGQAEPGAPHLEALTTRKRDAEALAAALTDAERLVMADYYAVVAAEQENPAYAAAVDKSRKRLAKIADDLTAAATEAGIALGTFEWVHEHRPYDASVNVLAGDVTDRINQLAGSSGIHRLPVTPTDLAHVIADLIG